MKKSIIIILNSFLIVVLFFPAGCNSNASRHRDIPADSVSIAKGQITFLQNCSACHNFRQNGIGPQLGGITEQVSSGWIKDFVKNPKALVESGDERSKKLFAQYKTLMPSFAGFSDEDLNHVVAYLNTQKRPDRVKSGDADLQAITDPIPEPIQFSGLVVDLDLVTRIPASSEKRPLTRITKLDFLPNSDRLFMLDLRGKLYELKNRESRAYLDIAELKSKFIDDPGLATGFGSFAFHPEFLKNGLLYTSHAEAAGSGKADFHYADSIPITLQWVVSEWKTEQPAAFPFKGKCRELFRINMVTGMHGVQEITFNPYAKPGDEDYGLLYIGIGDGASVEEGYPFLCHWLEKPWGTIFRIDPHGKNSANSQYGIPSTNPFVKSDNPQALGEIYAYGFRNPHRITWTKSGLMLVANIGQAKIESVNQVMPGHDYGWPIREGTFKLNPYGDISKVYPLPADDATFHVSYPIAQYDHGEGSAITGGFEYTGSAVPLLAGKYLFGDIVSGRLFYIDLADVKAGSQTPVREWKITFNGRPATVAELCGSERVDLRFGRDQHGEIYLFSKQDGKVYRLAGANNNI